MNKNIFSETILLHKKKHHFHTTINNKNIYQIYPNKSTYDIQIPLNIFQTWHTKLLPPLMFQAVKMIKKNNPKFNYFLFDDNDCRNFIKTHFDSTVLNAYDSLIPGAYKADLWRYCVLYIHGGIYLDIKYMPMNGFKFINFVEKEYWVLDHGEKGIYNALMICKPKNELLLKAIHKIVDNVKKKYYGTSFLEPTGPKLLIQFFNEEDKKNMEIKHIVQNDKKYIQFNDYYILQSYPGYSTEHHVYKKIPHYAELWKKKIIYR
jgi:mannosyltransferase OCH1-like enzyme